jgi:hypothetical protein
MDKQAKKPKASHHAGHFARRLEKVCVFSLILSMMSQVNSYVAMPTYNSILAGWGLFTVYSRSSRAVFGLLGFVTLSILLDIIYLSVWSSGDSNALSTNEVSQASSTTRFSVTMMVFNMFAKTALIYYGTHLFIVLSNEDDIIETVSPSNSTSSSAAAGAVPSSESFPQSPQSNSTTPSRASSPPTTPYREPSVKSPHQKQQTPTTLPQTKSPVHSVPALNFSSHHIPSQMNNGAVDNDRTDVL